MPASPAHHDGGCHLFNSYPDHYYPSVVAASSHVPPPSPDGSPKTSVPYSVAGSSESSARRHSSPMHIGGGPQPLEIPDGGSLVADYDPHVVHNPTPETFFYPCSFDTCQGWISDDRRLMMDHLEEVHHIYLRGDSKSLVKCRWEGCTSAMMKGNFFRHILIHLQDRWECSVCKKSGTRSDSVSKHIKGSEECIGGTPTRLVSPMAYRYQMLGEEVLLTKVLGG
ncbi:hypothetical protein EDC04DRAFT_2651769 [Pisolithus marmoratus]|nr:hypothetical protein EDC04DRAFT_2651769 [Pisolithus marmoratus]